jgi:hypothetical protein
METAGVLPEGAERSEDRATLPWLAGYALSASYGVGGALVTGNWGTGLVVGWFAFAVVTLLFLLFPRFVDRRGASRRMLVHALVVALGPFVAVKLGLIKTAWLDLQDRYAATGRPSGDFRAAGDVVLVMPIDVIMVQVSKFGSIKTSFGSEGAVFAPRFPINLVYEPLQFPLPSISACSDSRMNSGYTRIQLVGTRIEVGVRDPKRKVLAWCREHGKPENPNPRPEGLG